MAMPKHPVPAALTGSYEAGVVKLTWEAPDFNSAEPEPLTDDFEAYAPFATAGAGGWLFTDADGQQVGKLDITMPGIPSDKADILKALADDTHPYALSRGQLQLAARRVLGMILKLTA